MKTSVPGGLVLPVPFILRPKITLTKSPAASQRNEQLVTPLYQRAPTETAKGSLPARLLRLDHAVSTRKGLRVGVAVGAIDPDPDDAEADPSPTNRWRRKIAGGFLLQAFSASATGPFLPN